MSRFKLFGKSKERDEAGWSLRWAKDGVQVRRAGPGDKTSSTAYAGLSGLLTQLVDDGYATRDVHSEFLLPWENFYAAAQTPNYAGLPDALGLPRVTESRPVLSSRNALIDSDFTISIAKWVGPSGEHVVPVYIGALINAGSGLELMTFPAWQLVQQVVAFARRDESAHTPHAQELAWGRIRRTAVAAGADMSDFLVKTVVLSPERLDIKFRRSDAILDDTVVEIIPGFEGAPDNWLAEFDRFSSVQDSYKFALENGGLIHVAVSPQVKAVLSEVKRLPGRRVAGSRAQAFLLNPFATLGEAATDVIDEEQFEQAREDAGLQFERFTAVVEHGPSGFPERVGILVDSARSSGPQASTTHYFDDISVKNFIARVERAQKAGLQLVFWEGHELELLGDSEEQLSLLRAAYEQRTQPPTLVTYSKIHDLSSYSSRIEGVGLEKPYYSPYIVKRKEDEGWFPENVLPVVVYTPEGESEQVAVAVSEVLLEELKKATTAAAASGNDTVSLGWLPKPIPLTEAKIITGTFDEVLSDVKNKAFDPDERLPPKSEPKKTLVLRANIDTVDYDEQRRDALNASPVQFHPSRGLSTDFALLEHQVAGVARMQHLYSLRERYRVRGLVLADDMGLGKTLQLLALMTSVFEREPNTAPMLVVAPVSLLENWREEAERFFPGVLRILTAYGEALKPLRVPRDSVDEKLRTEDGLVKFLKPNWVGNAQLVLTTYETLRDLEFSFALQKWSIMVCDEAQRIKNPAAMVTRAAKKQNASFNIACTGTPVENTLADLWCLFDFVQPGLLGALNDFGKTYRRPIEIDERDSVAQGRIEELRTKIEPQILRRTKLEVAKDLPRKIIAEDCRRLPLSSTQRNLYAKAIEDFKKQRSDPEYKTPFKNHLGLLHYLRLVCTDPRRHGLTVFKPEPIGEYRRAAPKLDWLLTQLKEIQTKGEKVIVFCEFRNIQRLLQHYIAEVFGYEPDIINGDTSASAEHANSRQKRIKAFQAKPGFGVIILSPVAVGFGVNIQGANHVVHYTRTWNPAKEDQASDRAWRIGQTKDVYVYYPVVAADDFITFDVKLDRLLERKRSLAGDMLNGSPDISPADFRVEEVVPDADADFFDERVTLDVALRMEWRHFEGLTAALWAKKGFDTVYCTPAAGDNGVDVVAILEQTGELVQTKTSSSDSKPLNWDAVKEVVAGEAFYKRKHPGVVFKKVGLTSQSFNLQAHDNARLNDVMLLERPNLADMLNEHHVTMLDVERILYTDWASTEA
ncbi:SNF2-related protein [Ottowia caeni]|uniref:SNF2-related protein n=1 Tax=Ottowia caeni TaxID=2870339 RepID=UPI003D75070D|nr:restriction endonuclease [Ottowia caeni]